LGNTPRAFLIFMIWPILWPTVSHLENQTCHLLTWTVVGKLTKFWWEVYLIRPHLILPGFWIWPAFQGHRGQS
jgi:hypothetical protein